MDILSHPVSRVFVTHSRHSFIFTIISCFLCVMCCVYMYRVQCGCTNFGHLIGSVEVSASNGSATDTTSIQVPIRLIRVINVIEEIGGITINCIGANLNL